MLVNFLQRDVLLINDDEIIRVLLLLVVINRVVRTRLRLQKLWHKIGHSCLINVCKVIVFFLVRFLQHDLAC